VLALLQGLPTSQKVLWPSEHHFSLLYKTSVSSHFCWEEYGGICMEAKSLLWVKVGLRGPTCQAGRQARVSGWPSFLAALTLDIGCPMHWPSLTHWQSGVWKGANTWLASQGGDADRPHFGSVGPRLCATSSPHVIFSVPMPYFWHIEDMHVF
jgi:hypothetical protein